MADRKKVIKAYERCISNPIHNEICNDCEYRGYIGCYHGLMSDALKLLKEQESIVRCVDCEEVYFAGNRVPSEQSLVCGRYGMDVKDNFFCANGVRKVREDYME